jgi:hypothetical protein
VEGRTFIVEFHDLVASLGYFRQGRLTLQEWWLSLKGTREWAWLSRDDPLPFVIMGIRLLLRVVARILRIRLAPNTAYRMPYYAEGLRNWFTRKTHKAL